MNHIEWSVKCGVSVVNYQRNRKKRALALCEAIGEHAEYDNRQVATESSLSSFSSFDEAVDSFTHEAKRLGVVYSISEVFKREGSWSVSYRVLTNRN